MHTHNLSLSPCRRAPGRLEGGPPSKLFHALIFTGRREQEAERRNSRRGGLGPGAELVLWFAAVRTESRSPGGRPQPPGCGFQSGGSRLLPGLGGCIPPSVMEAEGRHPSQTKIQRPCKRSCQPGRLSWQIFKCPWTQPRQTLRGFQSSL